MNEHGNQAKNRRSKRARRYREICFLLRNSPWGFDAAKEVLRFRPPRHLLEPHCLQALRAQFQVNRRRRLCPRASSLRNGKL